MAAKKKMKGLKIIGFAHESEDLRMVGDALKEFGISIGGEGNRHVGYTIVVPYRDADFAVSAIEELAIYQSNELLVFLCEEKPDFMGTISNQRDGEYFAWRKKCSQHRAQ